MNEPASQKPPQEVIVKVTPVYRCRMCGTTFPTKIRSMNKHILPKLCESESATRATITHHCRNGSIGIADPSGFIYV